MDNGEGYRWHRGEKARTEGINLARGNVWMSLRGSNSVDIGVSYVKESRQNMKKDLSLRSGTF